MVAQGLIAAAGLRGKQNWALILSSVQESLKSPMKLLLQSDTGNADTPTRVAFGNHLADRQARIGGYLPVFWRSPHSVIHATGDIGQMIDRNNWSWKQEKMAAWRSFAP